MDIKKHLENRSLIARSLAGEIFGPDSSLHENNGYFSDDIDDNDNVEIPDFESWDEFNKYKEGLTDNGIELLEREPPSSKYVLVYYFLRVVMKVMKLRKLQLLKVMGLMKLTLKRFQRTSLISRTS